ncbi:MAG: CHAD domain-containing protein [Campylobacterales bacterium]|nr:CHAD domain-containing protein [Campylobacterales bacterium]
MKEIERKYLLDASILTFLKHQEDVSIEKLIQYYTKATPTKSIRYRKSSDHYFKTVKIGKGGIRDEVEMQISKKIYQKNRSKAVGEPIRKKRYHVKLDNILYSIDVYKKPFKPLTVLEVEFDTLKAYEAFSLPDVLLPYVEKEVTEDEAYKNKNLALFGLPLRDKEVQGAQSGEAVMEEFQKFYDQIETYRRKWLENKEAEDMHQLRVHLRKTIVLMDAAAFLFGDGILDKHRKELKKILSITNSQRDFDVLLDGLGQMDISREIVPFQGALEILQHDIERLSKEENQNIEKYLKSGHCGSILKHWKDFIEKAYRKHLTFYADYPIESVSGYILKKVHKQVGKKIYQLKKEKMQDLDVLHRLRILFKRLRYLLEVFGPFYSKKKIRKMLARVKTIQDRLGQIHDTHQAQMMLGSWFERNEATQPQIVYLLRTRLIPDLKTFQQESIFKIEKRLNDFLKQDVAF